MFKKERQQKGDQQTERDRGGIEGGSKTREREEGKKKVWNQRKEGGG